MQTTIDAAFARLSPTSETEFAMKDGNDAETVVVDDSEAPADYKEGTEQLAAY